MEVICSKSKTYSSQGTLSHSTLRPSVWYIYIDFCSANIHSTAEKDEELLDDESSTKKSQGQAKCIPKRRRPRCSWRALVASSLGTLTSWRKCTYLHSIETRTKCGNCADLSCNEELDKSLPKSGTGLRSSFTIKVRDRCWTSPAISRYQQLPLMQLQVLYIWGSNSKY